MIQPPYPLTMHVCEAAWVDPATQRRTIQGCYTAFQAGAFPTVIPVLCIFTELTDGRDQVTLSVRLTDTEEARPPIIDHHVDVQFPDPLEVLELDFHFTGVVFPLPGGYRAQQYADGEFLMERRITLVQAPWSRP